MNTKRINIGVLMAYILLIVLSVVILFPLIYALLGAFKTNSEVTSGSTFLPSIWMVSNYLEAWKGANFARYTLNTLFTCVFTTIGTVIITSMTGYCLSTAEFFGKKLLMGLFLATMFISVGAITLRPLYLLMVEIGLGSSLWSIILIQIGMNQSSNTFLVSRFIDGVAKELREAAIIDGCSFFGIYWRIILPLVKPILGVVALFSFRFSWNDYVLPSVFTMTRPDLRTLTVGVVSLRYGNAAAAQWNLMLAGATIAIIPMIVVYLSANKAFVSGLTAGSVKG